MIFKIKLIEGSKFEYRTRNSEIENILDDLSLKSKMMKLLNKFNILEDNNIEQFKNMLSFYKLCAKLIDKTAVYEIENTGFKSSDINETVKEFKNFWIWE